jgi:large subunit ribosomal protein L25
MKSIEIKATVRTIAERSSEQSRALKAIRKEGGVPCVVYGGKENLNLVVKEADLRKVVYTPHIYVIDLLIDGAKKNVILKDLQFHPVKEQILHVDFYEIDESKPIVMYVPLAFEGLAPGVQAGGKMHHQMRRAKVRAQYTVIPEKLTIDVSQLQLGKVIKIGDLKFDGLELIDPKDAVVCSVKMTRNATDATTTEETPEEGEAPAEDAAAAPAAEEKK